MTKIEYDNLKLNDLLIHKESKLVAKVTERDPIRISFWYEADNGWSPTTARLRPAHIDKWDLATLEFRPMVGDEQAPWEVQ